MPITPRNRRPGARAATWIFTALLLVAPWGRGDAQEPVPPSTALPEVTLADERAEPLPDGSGDGSGQSEGAAPEGSGAVEDPQESLAARAGRAVIQRAESIGPPLIDARAERLRVAEPTSPEAAELLGLSVSDLADRQVLAERLSAARVELDAAMDAVQSASSASSGAIERANLLRAVEPPSQEPITAAAVRRAQASAATVYAERLLSERTEAQRTLMYVRAVVRVLERRIEAVDVAEAVVVDDLEAAVEGEQLAEAIEEGRERLARESEATSAVQARALEAQERARIEREQARDAAERRLAEQWEELAPALERIVRERRIEEARLSALTQEAESLVAMQIDLGAELGALLAVVDEQARDPLADAFVDRLIERRRVARERLVDAHDERVDRRAVVATERHEVQSARAAVEGAGDASMSTELRSRFRELREEQLRIAEERLALQQLRAATAEGAWRLLETEINYYARTIDRLIPVLSAERRGELLRPTAANLSEARRNFVERVTAFQIVWSDRLFGESRMSDAHRVAWWSTLWRPLVVLLALVVARRTLPQWRHLVVSRVLALRELDVLRRASRYVVKLAEVVYVTLPQLLVFAALLGVRAWVPDRLAETDFVLATIFWLVGYRFASRASRTTVLPRRDRDPISVRVHGKSQRIGVDLFSFGSGRARLIQRTVRVWLLYFVLGRVGLATVRALLGPGFFYSYANLLFQIGLWVVVYLLGWYWRADIVQRFCASTQESSPFEEWLKARQNRPYIVLVVALLAAYLFVRWVLRVGAEWASGRGPGQRIANFLFQRRIERASTAVQSAVASQGPLPVAYQRVFRAAPLTNEAYRVPRVEGESSLRSALDAWRHDRVRGTVAIVGEPGAGKTTFLNGLPALVGEDAEPIVRVELISRITTTDALVAWMAEFIGVEARTRDELVATINAGEERVIAIDHCELLYLRCVGGFAAIDAFFDLVTLTNHRLFWVLSFDRYAWQYLHRVRDRRGYFRTIVPLKPMVADQLRETIEKRNEQVGVHPQFDRLSGSENPELFEEVRTSAGYYRLLAEASGGNLRVAQHLWLRSLVREPDGKIHVHLFHRADDAVLRRLSDELLFALTAVVQHAGMTNAEIARAINADPLTCEVYVNHLRELGVLEPCVGDRVRLAVLYYQSTIRRLRVENLLHLEL